MTNPVRSQLIASGAIKPGPTSAKVSRQALESRRHEARVYTPTQRALAILSAAVERDLAEGSRQAMEHMLRQAI